MKNDNWEDLDFGGEQKRIKIDQICAGSRRSPATEE
jgi:hypothetical protein